MHLLQFILPLMLCSILLLPAHRADAIVIAMPIAVSVLQVFLVMLLVLLIPSSLAGVAYRLVGGRLRNGTWHVSLIDSVLLFLKYLLYHIVFVGGWLALMRAMTPEIQLSMMNPFRPELGASLWLGGLWVVATAVVGPYLVHIVRKVHMHDALRPSHGLIIRLATWNVMLLWLLGIFYNTFVWV